MPDHPASHAHGHAPTDDHDLGLAHDLDTWHATLLPRRRMLHWLSGGAALALLGCGGGGATADDTGGSTSGSGGTSTSGGTTSGTSSCSVTPEETAGPYPGDGSNGANALDLSGVVRRDIRASFAGASGVAAGVPLTVTLHLVDASASCADLSGYAVYLWHCDREGRYSMYSAGVTGENYLRGVQETSSDGSLTFTTIFPGCYDGRMPHMHFEVYRSATTATSYANKLKTSQIAFPTEVCSSVYAEADGYEASIANLGRISFDTDNVFSDGVTTQLASLSGSIDAGYTATLSVGIDA